MRPPQVWALKRPLHRVYEVQPGGRQGGGGLGVGAVVQVLETEVRALEKRLSGNDNEKGKSFCHSNDPLSVKPIFVMVDFVIQSSKNGHVRNFSSKTKSEVFNFVVTNAMKRKHLSHILKPLFLQRIHKRYTDKI